MGEVCSLTSGHAIDYRPSSFGLRETPNAMRHSTANRTTICSLARMQMDISDLEVIQHRKHWK
jgi:hypothetical protein